MSIKYYADTIAASGKRTPLLPAGRRFFGAPTVAWLKKRAKRRGESIVVGVAQDKKARCKALMRWALANAEGIHYVQRRPMQSSKRFKKHQLDISCDCSESSTALNYAVGGPDPNGLGFNGSGFTGTIRQHAPLKNFNQIADCDFIVYGGGSGRHVVRVYDATDRHDPLVFSHGQESGPKLYRHSTELAVHDNVFTVHDSML